MSEMDEFWRDVNRARQDKRADNRVQSSDYLEHRAIPFVSKNGGAHLIVEGRDCFIDFWPGTGKWVARNGVKGFGVRSLVTYITGGTP